MGGFLGVEEPEMFRLLTELGCDMHNSRCDGWDIRRVLCIP